MSPARPSAAEVDQVLTLLGTDLALDYPGPSGYWEDADLAVEVDASQVQTRADVVVADRLRAADQLLVNRLKTARGELAALGHPDYGSRHHELIGEPNTERTRALIKLHVLDALGREPRIEEVLDCQVSAGHDPARDVVRIEVVVRLWRIPTPRNLVVPFNLAGAFGEAASDGDRS